MNKNRNAWELAIVRQALQDPERETCGLLVATESNELQTMPMANVHPSPAEFFAMDPAAYLAAVKTGTVRGAYHSHPRGPAEFSPADRAFCNETGLPYYLYSLPEDELLGLAPADWLPPLEGRQYLPGVNDCFSLCRDYLRTVEGLEDLPNPPRGSANMIHGLPGVAALVETAGFVRVTKPKPGDVVLMNFRSTNGRPNHMGVIVESGVLLHQLVNAPSRRDIYGGFWEEITLAILRHRSKC